MAENSSKPNLEKIQQESNLEVEFNGERSSNIRVLVTSYQQPTGSGSETVVRNNFPEVEGSCQSTEKCDQSGNLMALAKAHEAIDSTWSHLHKMWAEMGHDSETVKTLENGLIRGIQEFLGTVREDTIRQRYYNGNGVQIHPLLVDNIVDRIFEHVLGKYSSGCARADEVSSNIRNCRAVCKTWNERAIDLVLKVGPEIILGEHKHLDYQKKYIDLLKPKHIKKFLTAMKQSPMIPFQRYFIFGKIFQPLHGQLLEELFLVISSSATDIKVYFNCDWEWNVKKHNYNCWAENLQLLKLERFSVNYIEDSPVNVKSGVTQFIKQIFTSAPMLHEVVFSFTRWNKFNQEQFLPILRLIPKTVNVLHLVLPTLSDSHIEALSTAKLELNEFSLLCMELSCSTNSFEQFFETQKASLTYLNLCEETSKMLSSEFPQLRKVVQLNVVWEEDTVMNFSIADKFPAVVKLEIHCTNSNADIEKILEYTKRTPSMSIEELSLGAVILRADLHIKSAKECFPNVKILKLRPIMETGDDKLESVFEHFSQIEELHVYLGNVETGVGDSLLTGVPKDVCIALLQEGQFRSVEIQHIQTKYSMLNLTRLKKLHIWWDSVRLAAEFSDLSAHHIFLKMDNLEELKIKSINMSSEYEQMLREKLRKFTVG